MVASVCHDNIKTGGRVADRRMPKFLDKTQSVSSGLTEAPSFDKRMRRETRPGRMTRRAQIHYVRGLAGPCRKRHMGGFRFGNSWTAASRASMGTSPDGASGAVWRAVGALRR